MSICLLFLLPALHPLLMPMVGVPSHLLWFVHVLPVAWITYHRGRRGGAVSIAISIALLVVGERAFGAGYFVAADWQTVASLAVALTFTNVLVGGFADYARRATSLQEQLWRSQKMETLGLFAASVAHDFNNMLTAITLSTELALEETDAADPRRPQLTEIQRSAERAAMLSKRLLAFGRHEVVQQTDLNLAYVVRDLESMLRRLVTSRIELLVRSEPVPLILADRGHLEQIALNLVVNASDAIPGPGTITLSVRTALRDELPSDARSNNSERYVLLEVSDTGVGMDAELQRRIFEPLFTTKPPGKGTGLGLSTVRGLVDRWNGFVTLSSTVGRGTVFRVLLPATHTPADVEDVTETGVREPTVRLAS